MDLPTARIDELIRDARVTTEPSLDAPAIGAAVQLPSRALELTLSSLEPLVRFDPMELAIPIGPSLTP
jgi:hypothetical protein